MFYIVFAFLAWDFVGDQFRATYEAGVEAGYEWGYENGMEQQRLYCAKPYVPITS